MNDGPRGPGMGQGGPRVQVNLSDAETMTCPSCNNMLFTEVYMMKRLSALMSPTGESMLIPIQLYACIACGHVAKDFLPTNEKGEDSAQNTEGRQEESTFEYTGPKLVE